MKVCVLGSGSAGNCTYVETRKTRILIDIGFGPRSLSRRLKEAGLPRDRFDALLISHGHVDHWQGAGALVRDFRTPIFSNRGTRRELSRVDDAPWEEFRNGEPFVVGDVTIEAFPVLHDAADPVGFRLTADGVAGAVVTDLGAMTENVESRLKGCDWIVVEANHDEEMLRIGDYPWHLKQRLTSRLGHLSNRALARFVKGRFDGQARHLFLAHLSRSNNDPEIALETVRRGLESRPVRSFHDVWNPVSLHLTHQARPSAVVSL